MKDTRSFTCRSSVRRFAGDGRQAVPEAARGISILVTLILVMLGGSWVPAFLFPPWLQKIGFLIPTRWAVDGLDGTIWRGFTLNAALEPAGALLVFAALFGLVAVWRFRWES